jgi:hypothetical protein
VLNFHTDKAITPIKGECKMNIVYKPLTVDQISRLPKNTHGGVLSRTYRSKNKFNPGNQSTFSRGQLRDLAKANKPT